MNNLPVKTYGIERFLSSCSPKTTKALKAAWKQGEQLCTAQLPNDALIAVLMLAAWGKRTDIDLVDDYEELLQRTKAQMSKGLHHPDLYFASCIVILAERGDAPTVGGFEQIKIPEIFNDLLGLED